MFQKGKYVWAFVGRVSTAVRPFNAPRMDRGEGGDVSNPDLDFYQSLIRYFVVSSDHSLAYPNLTDQKSLKGSNVT